MANRNRWKHTIIEYVREWGKYTFDEKPFSQVDSLVLCQLSYLKFDHFVPGLYENREPISLKRLMENPAKDYLFADERFRENNKALLDGMYHSKRFGNLLLNYYVNVIESELQTQFSAITFIVSMHGSMEPTLNSVNRHAMSKFIVYIAYRGTDELLVGWREDFCLAIPSPVPAQRFSVDYLNRVMSFLQKGTDNPYVYVGGHSKGGNLAIYACLACQDKIFKNVMTVFCHDGPGLCEKLKQDFKREYEEVISKLRKTIPSASVVGMLFNYDDSYVVVKSRKYGLLQHDPFSWLIEDGEFLLDKELNKRTRMMDAYLNAWISHLDEEQIHIVVDTLFDVFEKSECDNLIELHHDWKARIPRIREELQALDPEVKMEINHILKKLLTF